MTLPTLRDRLGHNDHVRCDCGRVTNADMVIDLRGAPVALLRRVPNRTTLCDGCWTRLPEDLRVALTNALRRNA